MIGLKPHLREVFDSASIPELEYMVCWRERRVLAWDDHFMSEHDLDDTMTELEYLKAVLSHRRYEEQYGD